ncbi:unnamed protein product [Spirodela intermedia]|uniref:Uncharacterized protein n=1 Tax=Spirodela intermedia TaxID=51605 RepID=A0A7I8LKZ2_SPIIN|nr:unnamed protein product [Spirodela intermedia]
MGTTCSSLPWCHLQHTIGGSTRPSPLPPPPTPSSGDSAGNDHGSLPLAHKKEDQLKMPLSEAASSTKTIRSNETVNANIITA